jgi:hypothetical protein
MNEPWFNEMAWAWVPGTVFGTLAGLWGCLCGTFAGRGRGRKLVLGTGWAFFGLALVMLASGAIALATGQPYGVWYGLGWPGISGVILFGLLLPVMYRVYHDAETRRMEAQHL